MQGGKGERGGDSDHFTVSSHCFIGWSVVTEVVLLNVGFSLVSFGGSSSLMKSKIDQLKK